VARAKYVVFDETRIAAVVAADHYAAILVDGRELLSDESLEKLALRLDPAEFARVHRRAIVNVGFIRELHQEGDRRYVAVLSDAPATRIPISRERLDALKARVGIV
jgi:two-component system LytT family response regulator